MGNIVLLDELTINKIAAGEVIERPASVVKELMENSIDAGSSKITVEVQNGGINKIRVIDNGKGMEADDLEYAFERHATSKIRKADDLEIVKSMGFRGEALASIAAISNIEMITKTANNEIGNKIVVEAGKILSKEEVASQTGTTITINNLFFNTPVRYKFLKKDYTELGYIEDAVSRIALANPNIAIKLINGDKVIIQTIGNGDINSVIYNIYGKDISEGVLPIDYQYENIKITGIVGKPKIARNNRAYQMFFVNKRFIKDKTLSAATEQAFKGLLPIGKYGVLIVNLEIDPKTIDVNVHPTKLEIRFQEEQKVFKAVYNSIKDTLLKGDLIKSADKGEETIETNNQLIENNIDKEIEDTQTMRVPSFINLFKKKQKEDFISEQKDNTIEQVYNKKNNIEETFNTPTEYQVDIAMKSLNVEKTKEEKPQFDEMYVKTFGKLPNSNQTEEYSDVSKIENISVFEPQEIYEEKPNYKYIGILFSTYIVIEIKDEIYIIDQHAAHERIMYEKVKENYYNNKEKDSQIMLLPDIITLSHKEKNIIKENQDLFKTAGFMFEEFGDNTIKLIGVPNICIDLDTKELFLEILDEMDTVAITAKQEKEDKFISTIACKSAVKAKMNLSKEEIDTLILKLFKLPNPFTCPHGRPTAIKMSKIEIEKKFNRR